MRRFLSAHTFSRLFALLPCLCALLAFAGTGQAPDRQRGIPGKVVGDYIAPPPTLPKFFELVPVIVDAEVVRTGSPKVIRRAVLRTQELRALEVFKGSLSPGSLFKVVQPGGMAEDEAGTLHQGEYDMPLLEAGQRVLLFLGPQRDPAETYAIAFGPSGMFVRSATDPEKIVVPLGARAIQQFGGRSEVAADTLLSELRRLRDRR